MKELFDEHLTVVRDWEPNLRGSLSGKTKSKAVSDEPHNASYMHGTSAKVFKAEFKQGSQIQISSANYSSETNIQ